MRVRRAALSEVGRFGRPATSRYRFRTLGLHCHWVYTIGLPVVGGAMRSAGETRMVMFFGIRIPITGGNRGDCARCHRGHGEPSETQAFGTVDRGFIVDDRTGKVIADGFGGSELPQPTRTGAETRTAARAPRLAHDPPSLVLRGVVAAVLRGDRGMFVDYSMIELVIATFVVVRGGVPGPRNDSPLGFR